MELGPVIFALVGCVLYIATPSKRVSNEHLVYPRAGQEFERGPDVN